MDLPDRPAGRWTSLWIVALVSLLAQLALCQFFTFGEKVPFSEDVNPSKLWTLGYTFPPHGTFQVLNWLGVAYFPQALSPLSLAAAHASPWFFFTTYVPFISTCSLLAMAAFLRELEISRPSALFGAVTFAWQGDILSFIYPGHYGYMTSWPFFALAAWGALRANRTGGWPYAVISGACCGLMVGLITNADRGGIASLLIAALFLAPVLRKKSGSDAGKSMGKTATFVVLGSFAIDVLLIYLAHFLPATLLHWLLAFLVVIALGFGFVYLRRERAIFHLMLCVITAALIALGPLLALDKGNIANVKIGGESNREQTYKLVTQYSMGPAEALTYLVPGFYGWHTNNPDGMYWGWVGEWPDWPQNHQGSPNLNLAISTCGTVATLLAIVGAVVVLPGGLFGPDRLSDRQRFYARVLLVLGLISLVLSWGWHNGFYRYLFDYLPLMDKWRNPLKWLEMANFAVIPLGALGLDHLLRVFDPEFPQAQLVRRRFLGFIVAMLVLMVAGLFLNFALAEVFAIHFRKLGLDGPTVANMMSTMYDAQLAALAFTGTTGLLFLTLGRADYLRRWTPVNPWVQRVWQNMLRPAGLPLTLALALSALGALQLGWVAEHFIEAVPLHALTDSNPLLDTLVHEGDRVRCTVSVEDPTLNILLQNQFAALDISCLDISAASRIPDDLSTFLRTFDNHHARLWFLAGVKNAAAPQSLAPQLQHQADLAPLIAKIDGYTIAATPTPDLPSHALLEMKDYLAKATFVPGSEILSPDALLKRLIDPLWNPRATILLDHPPAWPSQPAGQAAASSDQVELQTYTPTEIALDVHATRNGFVLINDRYDDDWQVTVNGQSAPLLRADYILRAVAVPAGTSHVELHYVAHYLLPGTTVHLPTLATNLFSDGVMLAAWIVAGIALRRRPRG